jgi:hypothetical protein
MGMEFLIQKTYPNRCATIWKGTKTFTKLTQRFISSDTSSNIQTIKMATGGAVGLVMSAAVTSPSDNHAEDLANSAMEKIRNIALHPMCSYSQEYADDIESIKGYLVHQLTIAMQDPITFVHGCEIEITQSQVASFLKKDIPSGIPDLKVVVRAETVKAIARGMHNEYPVLVREKYEELFEIPGNSSGKE